MKVKKLSKKLLAWLCIVTLVVPMCSNLLAVTAYAETTAATPITSSQETTLLETIPYRQGGAESSGMLENLSSDIYVNEYDEKNYSYEVFGVDSLKIVQKGDYNYSDMIYCMNALGSFPTSDTEGFVYTNRGDFTDADNEYVKAWMEKVGITTENYNALVKLLNIVYLMKQDTTYKRDFIETAFSDILAEETVANGYVKNTTAETIVSTLTDDDIDVVQQAAMWYFTNGTNVGNEYYNEKFASLGAINVKYASVNAIGEIETVTEDLSGVRLTYAQTLYNYLIEAAKGNKAVPETSTSRNRSITYWTSDGNDTLKDMQPVVIITEEEETYDLALRKFAVSINGEATSGREPVVSGLDELASGASTTAIYSHAKSPLTVKKGDKVVYEIRIYNEGTSDAVVQNVVDYLPSGLSLVSASDSTINSKYGWVAGSTSSSGYQTITSDYLKNTTISGFDKDNLKLTYAILQVECEITGDLTSGAVLTNVAEVIADDGVDRDSNENSIDPSTLTPSFKGNTSNSSDLSDEDTYYKGLQDDDDFEKLVIEGDVVDFALKKFITNVNGEEVTGREPVVDVSPLNEGKDDANYTVTKTPVNVKTGDIVTFTIRVYNEGDISGYADEVTDYIPEGLGFLVNYNTNYNNYWSISEDASSVKLSTIKNGDSNLSLDDFIDVESLDDVEVVLGKTKVTSTALSYSQTSTANLISAFDGTNLDYRDVQITCIVTTEDEVTLKNISAITAEKNEDGENVPSDREGTESTPVDDINPDDYGTGNEDDDDYDILKTTDDNFDLALQKFITGLNDEEVTTRVPTVALDEDGNIYYTHTSDALSVGNGDLVTYTIRVYNEGNVDGYASEISDDIPNGLEFVEDNEINQKYGWVMLDASGNETTDVSQAVAIKTTYLSKENGEENLLKAFDENAGISATNPDYRDVQVVFKVNEDDIEKTASTEERTIINTAEITEATDKDGNDIPDIDSTPNNGNLDEDDIDQEKVYVKYFDLSLIKDLSSAVVTVEGESKTVAVENGTIKVDVDRHKLDSTVIQFIFNITVTNEGEIAGYATEISDYIPEGLYFEPADNPDWTKESDEKITTNALAKTLLQPGESASVQVTLRWTQSADNIGKFVNVAEISEDWNEYDSPDIDSTPNNLVDGEDDIDNAPVYVAISTGLGGQPYIILTTIVLGMLGTGIILIKKYVL